MVCAVLKKVVTAKPRKQLRISGVTPHALPHVNRSKVHFYFNRSKALPCLFEMDLENDCSRQRERSLLSVSAEVTTPTERKYGFRRFQAAEVMPLIFLPCFLFCLQNAVLFEALRSFFSSGTIRSRQFAKPDKTTGSTDGLHCL